MDKSGEFVPGAYVVILHGESDKRVAEYYGVILGIYGDGYAAVKLFEPIRDPDTLAWRCKEGDSRVYTDPSGGGMRVVGAIGDIRVAAHVYFAGRPVVAYHDLAAPFQLGHQCMVRGCDAPAVNRAYTLRAYEVCTADMCEKHHHQWNGVADSALQEYPHLDWDFIDNDGRVMMIE